MTTIDWGENLGTRQSNGAILMSEMTLAKACPSLPMLVAEHLEERGARIDMASVLRLHGVIPKGVLAVEWAASRVTEELTSWTATIYDDAVNDNRDLGALLIVTARVDLVRLLQNEFRERGFTAIFAARTT